MDWKMRLSLVGNANQHNVQVQHSTYKTKLFAKLKKEKNRKENDKLVLQLHLISFFFFSLTWVSGPVCAHLD
jgi:hypothetical protein